MKIRLADIDPLLDTVELPSGREITVHYADAGTIELLLELEADPANLQRQLAIVQRILPDASAEDIRSLTLPMIAHVIRMGTQRGLETYQRLGESSATEGKRIRRSRPVPPSPTSASA